MRNEITPNIEDLEFFHIGMPSAEDFIDLLDWEVGDFLITHGGIG